MVNQIYINQCEPENLRATFEILMEEIGRRGMLASDN